MISLLDLNDKAACQAFVNLNIDLQSEGFTRHGLELPGDQEKRIRHKLIAGLKDHPHYLAFVLHIDANPDPEAVALLLCEVRYSTYKLGSSLYLEDLWVHPEHRRQGHARKLLDRSIEYAQENKFVRVELTTTANNKAAGALYSDLGFSCAQAIADGRLEQAVSDMGEDPAEWAVVLKLSLDD